MSDYQPRWLFRVKAIAAVIGLLIVINTLLLILFDQSTPLGSFARSVFGMISDQTICDPDTSTTEEFDRCLQQGGVEPSHSE